jgi:hypothetical protein
MMNHEVCLSEIIKGHCKGTITGTVVGLASLSEAHLDRALAGRSHIGHTGEPESAWVDPDACVRLIGETHNRNKEKWSVF